MEEEEEGEGGKGGRGGEEVFTDSGIMVAAD